MGSTRATDEKEKWKKWAPPPQLSVVAQLLTAPHEQGNCCKVGTPHSTCPQCLAGSESLGMSPEGHGKCSAMATGVSLSPPKCSASTDAEGIRRKDLEVINFCYKSKETEKNGKNGMVLQRISEFLPILLNSQSLHRQPCRYFT